MGVLFDIQRFCLHDGPGIRSTIFLKGCPLNCAWCHNPESKSLKPTLFFDSNLCSNCKACENVCKNHVHIWQDGKHQLLREKCTFCGACEKVCPSDALELIGKELNVASVLAEVRKDKAYYRNSNGGVTLSGGEPLLQVDFARGLLQALKQEGLHTAVETCGYVDFACFLQVNDLVDVYLYDLKIYDETLHKQYTGASNKLIIENLKKLDALSAHIMLRCIMIPGINDRQEHIQAICSLMKELKNIQKVEILPYHDFGLVKSQKMDIKNPFKVEKPTEEQIASWKTMFQSFGVTVDV